MFSNGDRKMAANEEAIFSLLRRVYRTMTEEMTPASNAEEDLLISPWKSKGKNERKSYYNTGYSYLVTHSCTVSAEQDLTLLSRRKRLLSLWYIDSTVNALFFLIFRMRKGKLEEYENENYFLFW